MPLQAPRPTWWIQLASGLGLAAVLFVFGGWLAVRIAVAGPSDRVPNLRGMGVQEATEALRAVDMQVDIDDDRLPIESVPADHVARQIPGAGTPLKRMRVVRLMLSSGPRELELPTMVGESRPRAMIALQQEGFELDYVAVAPSTEVPRDTIIAQEPEPAELAPGETAPLRLLTSLGPPARSYVMADLVGRSARSVRPLLESVGFRVTEGPNRRVLANVPPGTIVGQRPSAGFRITAGGEIVLQVSR